MIEIEEIECRLFSGEKIEDIVFDINWKDFEDFISKILEKNEYRVLKNFRFKTFRRYEIDIVSIKDDLALLIDCKRWCSGRYKKFQLKESSKKQMKRVEEFKKIIKEYPDLSKIKRILPVIVTWFEEDLVKEGEALIIPLWKLNHFLNNMETEIE
ncbi:MAG: NERD domain-containing protein [Candidatus Aenigmatarchaeota archaeon]